MDVCPNGCQSGPLELVDVVALYKKCKLPVAYFASHREVLPKNEVNSEKSVVKKKRNMAF